MALGGNYTVRVESLRDLIEVYDREIVMLERDIHAHLRHHRGYQAVQAINGVGPTIAAIFVAEIGDVTRFPTPPHLCSWAGLTPAHRESDVKATTRGDHQTRIEAVALGVDRGDLPLPRRPASSPASSVASPNGAARTRPGSPSPARCSPSPTTGCATARSAASPTREAA